MSNRKQPVKHGQTIQNQTGTIRKDAQKKRKNRRESEPRSEVEYIRFAQVRWNDKKKRLEWYLCPTWWDNGEDEDDEVDGDGIPTTAVKDGTVYPVSNFDEELVQEFFQHVDSRCFRPNGKYRNGDRLYARQDYINLRIILQCIVRRDAEEAQETAEVRLARDAELLHEYWNQRDASNGVALPPISVFGSLARNEGRRHLEEILRERADFTFFSLRDDAAQHEAEFDEVADWLKKVASDDPLVQGRLPNVDDRTWYTARTPYPVQDDEHAKIDLDVITMWWDDLWDVLEPPYAEDVDKETFRPLMLDVERQGLVDSLWPSNLLVVEEREGMSHSQVLITLFGSIRRATREWRAVAGKECALGERAMDTATECGHFMCKAFLMAWLRGGKDFCPYCRRQLEYRPFPAHWYNNPNGLNPTAVPPRDVPNATDTAAQENGENKRKRKRNNKTRGKSGGVKKRKEREAASLGTAMKY